MSATGCVTYKLNPETGKLRVLTTLFGGKLSLFATRGGVVGLNLVATLLLAAILSPADFGRFVFLWAVVSLLSAFAALGGHGYLMREASARQADPVFGVTRLEAAVIVFVWPAALLLAVAAAVLVFGPTLLSWTGREPPVVTNVALVSAAAFMLVLLGHAATPFRIEGQQVFSMLVRDAGPHAILILSALVAGASGSTSSWVVLTAFVCITAALVTALFLRVFVFRRTYTPFWREAGSKRGKGILDFWGNTILSTVSSQIDILLGGLVLSDVALGQYQILKRLANLTSLPQIVADWAKIVDVGRLFAANELARVQNACRDGARISFLPSVVLLLIMIGAMPVILSFYEIESDSRAWSVFLLLAGASLANVFCGINFIVANQCGMERHALYARILAVLLVAFGILLKGNELSDVALAFAAFFASTVSNLALVIWLRRNLGIDTSALSLFSRARQNDKPV